MFFNKNLKKIKHLSKFLYLPKRLLTLITFMSIIAGLFQNSLTLIQAADIEYDEVYEWVELPLDGLTEDTTVGDLPNKENYTNNYSSTPGGKWHIFYEYCGTWTSQSGIFKMDNVSKIQTFYTQVGDSENLGCSYSLYKVGNSTPVDTIGANSIWENTLELTGDYYLEANFNFMYESVSEYGASGAHKSRAEDDVISPPKLYTKNLVPYKTRLIPLSDNDYPVACTTPNGGGGWNSGNHVWKNYIDEYYTGIIDLENLRSIWYTSIDGGAYTNIYAYIETLDGTQLQTFNKTETMKLANLRGKGKVHITIIRQYTTDGVYPLATSPQLTGIYVTEYLSTPKLNGNLTAVIPHRKSTSSNSFFALKQRFKFSKCAKTLL